MDGSAFVKVKVMQSYIHASAIKNYIKRGRSGVKTDLNFIKLKRSETPDDIASALLKEGDNIHSDNAEDIYKTSTDDDEQKGEDDDEQDDKDGAQEGEDDDVDDEDANEGTETGKEQQVRRRVSHGHHLVEGQMAHGMEDYLVATTKKIDERELGLYAIFDGHSGRKVAEYLQSHLFENILNQPNFWTKPEKAVKRAYKATDNDILENVIGSRGGSTAVTAILVDRKELVVANVGDSRAVICRNGKAKLLTADHEPMRERKAIESKGGFVSKKPGNVPRVDGQLAMARAFGDERLKDHIMSKPDVIIEKMDEDTEFIILASDGLWKVMSNEEAVDCIRGKDNGQEAAEELIKEALLRESKDDISCVVVMFHQ